MSEPLVDWYSQYSQQSPPVRSALAEGWSLYGEIKDGNTLRFISWHELPDGKYEFKDVTPE